IAKLVTHSFGRTVKLAEHARLAAIGSFASGIAHEMRSPLSTIGLALEYLRNSQLPPPAEKRALLAQQESERLTRLSEEILLYAKPLQLNLATLEINQFLRQFLRQQNSLLAQRNQHHQLTIDIDTGTIIGDKDRLKQVFLNLASNACEASPEGSRIDWRLSRDPRDQVLTLTISNPGVPISLATMERLFDPFFTTKPSGTGLGLGITRRIVHAHGGEMLIRPIETGTEVRLLIPLA
ncbi:MAG: histidine kinase, partial [Gammaproteobacteria bacterium]|nr:histidine kinase [Gammaproteobacteria bacterium]